MADLEDSSLSTTSDENPPVSKKVKFTGAFKYKTSFSLEWKKTWSFLLSLLGNPHMFHCTICSKNLSCAHQGATDVKDHIATKMHLRTSGQDWLHNPNLLSTLTHFDTSITISELIIII